MQSTKIVDTFTSWQIFSIPIFRANANSRNVFCYTYVPYAFRTFWAKVDMSAVTKLVFRLISRENLDGL